MSLHNKRTHGPILGKRLRAGTHPSVPSPTSAKVSHASISQAKFGIMMFCLFLESGMHSWCTSKAIEEQKELMHQVCANKFWAKQITQLHDTTSLLSHVMLELLDDFPRDSVGEVSRWCCHRGGYWTTTSGCIKVSTKLFFLNLSFHPEKQTRNLEDHKASLDCPEASGNPCCLHFSSRLPCASVWVEKRRSILLFSICFSVYIIL